MCELGMNKSEALNLEIRNCFVLHYLEFSALNHYHPQYLKRMKTTVHTDKAPAAIGPYSQAILVNGFLYTSGQIALNPETGELEMQNIEHETSRVMQNLKAVLEAVEMDFSNVIKTTIYLSDMAYYAQVNAIYAEFFGEHPPAREAVQVAGLPKGVNVEISCIAFK